MAYLRYEPGHGVIKAPKGQYRLLGDGSIIDQWDDNKTKGYLLPMYTVGEIDYLFKMRSPQGKQRILRNHIDNPEKRQEIAPTYFVEKEIPEPLFRQIPMQDTPERQELKKAIEQLS